MRVLIITNLYPRPWDPNRGVFNKHQFHWLERSNELKIVVLVPWLEAWKNRSALTHSDPEGKVSYLPYFYTPKLFRSLYAIFMGFSMIPMLRRYARFRPECVLCSWAFPDAVAGTVLARMLGVPTIIKVHGSDINEYLKFRLLRTQIIWAMSKAAAVVSVSDALKQRIVACGAEARSIHVVYNGVDKSIFKPMDYAEACQALGVAEGRKRILFVGNLKKDKGCLDLLEAFKDLIHDNEDSDLVFIGKGACHGVIERDAALLPAGRVTLLGALPQAEIARWMNASWVVALPSKNEGVPNVLLEAMSCGVQVVASKVGGIPEIVHPLAGQVYEWGNKQQLVACLQAALKQREQQAVIAQTVSRFTWEKNESEMNAILASAV